MNISKMKKAAEKLIAAEGRKETLAALSDFAQVCGPEKILALIERLEKVMSERNRFAANWHVPVRRNPRDRTRTPKRRSGPHLAGCTG